MKICFIAPANNYHTQKWSKWFDKRGHQVYVISFTEGSIEDVVVYVVRTGARPDAKDSSKLKYLLHAREIIRLVDKIKPDIVNVHYASSYGAVTALSGLKGYVLSLWGSDVYDFPKKDILHKYLLKFSLKKAEYIFSTSKAMADEARRYTNKGIDITPFGVDIELFNPNKRVRSYESDGVIRIGTVKALTPKYGIDCLIKAFALFIQSRKADSVRLEIAGKGECEEQYKRLAHDIGIEDFIIWHGFVTQEKAAEIWANLDIAVVPSESESFGVSAVEAQASGTPVIISDIPGLMEATMPEVTSIVFGRGNEKELANIIERLVNDSDCRHEMQQRARQFVSERYEIHKCFSEVEQLFDKIIRGEKW